MGFLHRHATYHNVAVSTNRHIHPQAYTEKRTLHTLGGQQPFFVLGGQCGNSSNWASMLPNVWNVMKEMHANTLEIPVYWEQLEPQEGKFDFSQVQSVLNQARQNNMRLIFLWFATWKNGSNHYMPEWMKTDSKKYPNVVGKMVKK